MGPKTTELSLETKTNIPQQSNSSYIDDSWEDDVDELSSEAETETATTESATVDAPHGRSSLTGATLPIPNAPPPTPVAPRADDYAWSQLSGPYSGTPMTSTLTSQIPSRLPSSVRDAARTERDSDKRPEKTTAAASRMIAAGLGVRTPKKTEEERKYERAIKEAEIRKQNKEREAKRRKAEENEKAKAAVWDG